MKTINNNTIYNISDNIDILLDKIEYMDTEEFNSLKKSIKLLIKSCNNFTENVEL